MLQRLLYLLYVQEVLSIFFYSKSLNKVKKVFFDLQYIECSILSNNWTEYTGHPVVLGNNNIVNEIFYVADR